MQAPVSPDQIPSKLKQAFRLVATPDLSGIASLGIGNGIKFEFQGLNQCDLTRAANNIRNRARRIGAPHDMKFAVHKFGESAVYLVRVL